MDWAEFGSHLTAFFPLLRIFPTFWPSGQHFLAPEHSSFPLAHAAPAIPRVRIDRGGHFPLFGKSMDGIAGWNADCPRSEIVWLTLLIAAKSRKAAP